MDSKGFLIVIHLHIAVNILIAVSKMFGDM